MKMMNIIRPFIMMLLLLTLSVYKECYFTLLGINKDDSREVLSIVNHPAEGIYCGNKNYIIIKKMRFKIIRFSGF